MKLHFVSNTRSTRPRWLLEELGVPYELARLDPSKGETRTAEYLAVHPLGQVPALQDGEVTVIESTAIILHLADRFAERGLAPAPGTALRGRYYQWIVYAMVTVEPHCNVLSRENRKPEAERNADTIASAKAELARAGAAFERELTGREFILGDTFSAADVVVASVLGWARLLGATAGLPTCEAYARRLLSRPAAKAARDSG